MVWLHALAVKGCLEGLVDVSEGHLELLQRLILPGIRPECSNMPSLHSAMLERMPLLQCVNGIGLYALQAPFDKTIRGQLLRGTVKCFQEASIAHCIGFQPSDYPLDQGLPAIESIKTWEGVVHCNDQAVASCAPKLETLCITVRGLCDEPFEVCFTPFLKSVDVKYNKAGAVLLVHGLASQELIHLRLVMMCYHHSVEVVRLAQGNISKGIGRKCKCGRDT